jgi:hypothetical protein
MTRVVGTLLLITLVLAPFAVRAADNKQAAMAAAQSYLSLVDAGKFGEAYDQSAAIVKKSLTRDQFVQQMNGAMEQAGKMTARKLKVAKEYHQLPQAPPGDYYLIEYNSQFAKAGKVVERIVPQKEKDGKWRVSGYHLVNP